jgi:hypothetical protein
MQKIKHSFLCRGRQKDGADFYVVFEGFFEQFDAVKAESFGRFPCLSVGQLAKFNNVFVLSGTDDLPCKKHILLPPLGVFCALFATEKQREKASMYDKNPMASIGFSIVRIKELP